MGKAKATRAAVRDWLCLHATVGHDAGREALAAWALHVPKVSVKRLGDDEGEAQ